MDYSKYHFNYFDVIKRHERIINRPKDWEIKIFAIIMLMVTFIYTFTNFGFCSEVENVHFDINDSIRIDPNSNVFVSNGTGSIKLGYFMADPGYVYYIKNLNQGSSLPIATSSELPSLNVNYNYLGVLAAQDTFTFRGNGNVYFNINTNSSGSNVQVTREKLANYEGAVGDLVDNVGVNQIWGVFENGISFVGVVVLVAFGLFLVVLAIKKVSKGKSDF